MARRALERSAAERHADYVEDVRRIVDATYRLIERTGGIDPSLRDVLAEAGLSTQAFYRFFRSKDELMLVLLDDGRRRLLGYLEHRMARATSPADKVRAWIEGVLAQAGNPAVAARTRPFLAHQDRLAEAFPEEQQASVDLLVGLLVGCLEETSPTAPRQVDAPGPRRRRAARRRGRLPARLRHAARSSRPGHGAVAGRRRPSRGIQPPCRGCPDAGGGVVSDDRVLGDVGSRVVFENDRVRVWQVRLKPGEQGDVHRHELDHLLVQVAGDRIAVVPEPDSKGPFRDYLEADVIPGAVVHVARGGVETARNVGAEPYLEVVVELKD